MYLITLAVIVFLEMLLRWETQGIELSEYFHVEIFLIFLISCAVAAIPYFFRTVLKGKKGKFLYAFSMVLLGVFYCVQMVYNEIFGTYVTLYSVLHGTGQILEFYEVAVENIKREIIPICTVAVVVIAAIIVVCRMKSLVEKKPKAYSRWSITFLLMLLLTAAITSEYIVLSVEDDNPKSPYQKVCAVGELKSTVESVGFVGGIAIDSFRAVFGFVPKMNEVENYVDTVKSDNVIDSLDFKALADNEEDETLRNMHIYFGAQTPTKENDKTGIFEGKNLIFITAEAFSDFAVDPVYTPTLYKLQKEGFEFTNFYNPVWGTSTLDGEYVNLQGLVPKPGVWSMRESADNYLPFTFGNQFKNLGYLSNAYHNHSVYYYDRDLSHPNLGYDFKGQGREYSFTETWPESDLEMIDKTTEDFLVRDENGEIKPFNVYYLTVSGHLLYTFNDNYMSWKNAELVEDMPLSDSCKAYMAAQIELDRAIELLIERLDEAGVLEDTVIALAGDHYPYGLTSDEISEFRGHEVDEEYELYESTFLLWNSETKHKKVDKVCSNMDILPTLSNMFGLEYDSRLLMGKDIFSDSEGFVVFKDKDWISDKGTRRELSDQDLAYVSQQDKKAADMFNYSTLILDKDYYRKILE